MEENQVEDVPTVDEEDDEGEMCESCGVNPPVPGHAQCGACGSGEDHDEGDDDLDEVFKDPD